MSIDKELKKRLSNDWQQAFPQLKSFAQNKFYKIVGCLLVGIELIKLPRIDEFRPHFVVYSLWKMDFRANLSKPFIWEMDFIDDFGPPFILREFYNKRGFQFNIPYEKYGDYLPETVESIRQQSFLPLEGDISIQNIFWAIDKYSKSPPLSAAPDSFFQAALQEVKLMIALYISKEYAENVLELIYKRNWDTQHFEMCNVDIDIWLNSLRFKIEDRENFLEAIEVNKQDKKLLKLKRFVFLD